MQHTRYEPAASTAGSNCPDAYTGNHAPNISCWTALWARLNELQHSSISRNLQGRVDVGIADKLPSGTSISSRNNLSTDTAAAIAAKAKSSNVLKFSVTAAVGVSPGFLAYDLASITNLEALLQAHKAAQDNALLHPEGHPAQRAIKVKTRENAGLGNRIPSIVTAFAMALLTRRVFLLESSILQHMKLPLEAEWSKYRDGYKQASKCSIRNISRLADPKTPFCGEGVGGHEPVLMTYDSADYDMPFVQINPLYQPLFARFFPDGEVFHTLSAYLLSETTPLVQDAMRPYLARAPGCLVGVHMRLKKLSFLQEQGSQPFLYSGVAKALAQSQSGNIFVASDEANMFKAMQDLLPGREVWWTDISYRSVSSNRTSAGNPGTELSAIVDMLLLARCQHIVVTPASSFGAVAAGLAGVKPVYATFGPHDYPFHHTWFWQSVTSEPCCFKLGRKHHARRSHLAELAKQVHPLFFFHNQCHP